MSGQDGVIRPPSLPFSAIIGQDDAKLALLVAAVNPHIKAIMLKGAAGTAKTTLARSITGIDPGKSLVNVPQNITDEQLFGSIDLDKAMSGSTIELGDSLLKRAHGNYLYLDDCDLLDIHTLTTMMNNVMEGRVRVERDSVSTSYPLDTTVIASMHSAKKNFDPHVNDCFDICAIMRRDREDIEGGVEVLRRNLGLDDGIDEIFLMQDAEVAERIAAARKIVKQVQIPRFEMRLIARLCQRYGVAGCRGAISAAHTARAIAALDGRLDVNEEDVSKAALLCIMHRRTIDPEEEERKKKEQWAKEAEERRSKFTNVTEGKHMSAEELEKRMSEIKGADAVVEEVDLTEGRKVSDDGYVIEAKPSINPMEKSGIVVGLSDGDDDDDDLRIKGSNDIMSIVEEAFDVIDLLSAADSRGVRSGDEVAKRIFAESGDRNGKYVKSRIPSGPCNDIAFDATIRAAAPYQISRRSEGDMGIKIHKSDVREKVREKEITSTFMFVIDNSGSINVDGCFNKIKKAVNSMMRTHYVKRDRVGLMTFNERAIQIRLHPSRAIEELSFQMNIMDVGRGTPLSEMFMELQKYIAPYVLKHPDERVHVVIITDGRATVAMERGADPVGEALEIAGNIDIPNVDWIIIDSGLSYTKNEVPGKLAALLKGKYFLLDDLQVKDEDAYEMWKGWNKDKYANTPMAKH